MNKTIILKHALIDTSIISAMRMAITQKDALLLFWVKISDKVKFSIKNVGNVPPAISLAAQKQATIFIMKQLQPCDGQTIIYPDELNAVAGTARDILFR